MLSLQDFLKLSDEEKRERYFELSSEDRLLARMSNWKPEDTSVIKGQERAADIENQKNIMKQLEKAISQGEVNLLSAR